MRDMVTLLLLSLTQCRHMSAPLDVQVNARGVLPEMLLAESLAGSMALAIHMTHNTQALISARLGTAGQYCLTALLDGQ